MNEREALREARKVLGKTAAVQDRGVMSDKQKKKRAEDKKRGKTVYPRYRYEVGTVDDMAGLGMFFIEGRSNTSFQAAINNAVRDIRSRRRKARKHARDNQRTCFHCKNKATFREPSRWCDEPMPRHYTCGRHKAKIKDPVPYPKALQD